MFSECLRTNFSYISRVHISKRTKNFNVRSSTYYIHITTKILTDFQICISAPLRIFIFARNFAFRQIRGSWFQIHQYLFKPAAENAQIRHFWSQICFFLFWTIFSISAKSRMLISNIIIVFQIYGPKYPNKAFLVTFFVVAIIALVVLLDFWYLDKLEGADFKYDISFFKFQSKNTQKEPFWSKFKNFYFCTKLCILINSRVLISNMAIIFQTYSP